MVVFKICRKAEHEDRFLKQQRKNINAHEAAETTIRDLRCTIQTGNTTIDSLQSQRTNDAITIVKLRHDIKALEEAQQRTKVEVDVVAKLESALRSEESRSGKLTDTVSRLEAEKAALVTQHETQVSALKSEVAAAKKELNSGRRRIEKLEQDVAHVKSALDFEMGKRRVYENSNNEVYEDEVCFCEVNFVKCTLLIFISM